jgi:hypothetical protein
MGFYNPLNLPFDSVSEEAGTLQFTLVNTDVRDLAEDNRYFFEVQLGGSKLVLFRDKDLNIRFIHSRPDSDIRIATVGLAGLRASERLSIILTWSKDGDSLSVSDVFSPNYIYAAQQTKGAIVPREESSSSVHGKLWSTGSYRKSLADVELSDAKGLWDWQLTSVYNLIDGLSACWSVDECKWRNALFKSTLAMQCIVILVTGFEAYTRSRFAEIEKEGKNPNIDALLKRFDPHGDSKKEREEYINETGGSILSSILEIRNGKGLINFQNFEQCKDAYNKCYGIKFGELWNVGLTLSRIQNYIKYRHACIHNKGIPTIGYDTKGYHILVDIPQVEEAASDFSYFVETLQVETLL